MMAGQWERRKGWQGLAASRELTCSEMSIPEDWKATSYGFVPHRQALPTDSGLSLNRENLLLSHVYPPCRAPLQSFRATYIIFTPGVRCS